LSGVPHAGVGLKKYLKAYLFLAAIAVVIIFLDQWTKGIVRSNLALGESWMPWNWLEPYARIVHWYNTGVAFGMFQQGGMIFAVLSSVIAIAILIYFPQVPAKDWALRLAMSMQFSGAIGNLIDRLTVGHVTDFISVGNFPVFNVADASITVGVFVLILGIWLQERKEKQQQKNLARVETRDTEIAGLTDDDDLTSV
jgi:signal peptidase II